MAALSGGPGGVSIEVFLEDFSVNFAELASTRLVELKCESGIAYRFTVGTGLDTGLGLGFRRAEYIEDDYFSDDGSDCEDDEEIFPPRHYFAPNYCLDDEPDDWSPYEDDRHSLPPRREAANLVNAFTEPFSPEDDEQVINAFADLHVRNDHNVPVPEHALLFAVSYRHGIGGGDGRMSEAEFRQMCATLSEISAGRKISLWIDSKRPRNEDASMLGWLRQGVLPYCVLPTYVMRSVAEDQGGNSFWARAEYVLSLRGHGQVIRAGRRTIYRFCPNGFGGTACAFAADMLLGTLGDMARLPNEDKDSMVIWAVNYISAFFSDDNRHSSDDSSDEAPLTSDWGLVRPESVSARDVQKDQLSLVGVVIQMMVGWSAKGASPWDVASTPGWGPLERQLAVGSILLDGRRRRGETVLVPDEPFSVFMGDTRQGCVVVNKGLERATRDKGFVVVVQVRFEGTEFSREARVLETRLLSLKTIEFDRLEFVCDMQDVAWS